MKVYLAGPMRGLPELNYPAFHAGAAKLRTAGHEVFNPAENPVGGEDGIREALGLDLAWITGTAEAVVLLPGWQASLGALAEVATARAIGIRVTDLDCFLDPA